MLKINNLVKRIKNKVVINNLNLSVAKGEIKSLIGLNGAGKTTLTEIICNVSSFDEGQILIDNVDLTNKKRKKLIKHIIGYVPQNFSLFPDLTVVENLEYIQNIFGENNCIKLKDVLTLCNLNGKENALAQNLSGGYKQFLSMACALIHNPKFLILDEPTSAMDPIFRRKFWDILLNEKSKGKTILLITHHLEELLKCDSFALMQNGRIIFEEQVKSIQRNNFQDFEDLLIKLSLKGEKNEL